MAEKISTLILKVDLSCHLCYKKIRKVLCKLQEKENIRSITYDEKGNAVIISGPFDPQKLSKKLKCKACKVIKDIQIKEDKEKPKEKPKVIDPPPPKPKEDPPKPKEEPPKPKVTPIKPEPEPPQVVPVSVVQEPEMYPPMWPQGPVCCGRPWFDGGYYVGCKCWTCGRGFGFAEGPCYDGYPKSTCQFFCEEDQSTCVVM
ncbi:protein PYRICULARIA ORYZAE RESISTANCE 21 [Dioscorea cayenensis subsp. rotundata]|uniref:Protein PYRICULARIA ORYZAE RESISTANCE 21 n=1 Tax=Dioscorea cayennensis subsp. rotundata TaxID=55577 RepID=A0AB40CLQ4_DIOCR|nr:protein PYRICULARIA ORYZAE RESISTANCE 21 [Dioscorea cayenensis subsp. rotundata]